jgi:mono/diheme cytochrome c family protein
MAQGDDRAQNQQIALADRLAVFRNDCATCHSARVSPETRTGDVLFASACTICHDAPHRASMVPDLAAISKPRDEAYWRKWIAEGVEKSLMPAFAKRHGGPLDALVTYLRAVSGQGDREISANRPFCSFRHPTPNAVQKHSLLPRMLCPSGSCAFLGIC